MKEYFVVFKVTADSPHDALCEGESYLQNGTGDIPADVTVGTVGYIADMLAGEVNTPVALPRFTREPFDSSLEPGGPGDF